MHASVYVPWYFFVIFLFFGQVRATDGDTRLGGEDIDARLVDHFLEVVAKPCSNSNSNTSTATSTSTSDSSSNSSIVIVVVIVAVTGVVIVAGTVTVIVAVM